MALDFFFLKRNNDYSFFAVPSVSVEYPVQEGSCATLVG
jgi:hypothetical protein